MKRRVVLALCAALACLGAGREAAAETQGDRMLAAFKDWAARNHVMDATFAATDPTGLIAKGSVGPRSPDDPIPVYTLSRPLMEVCKALTFRDMAEWSWQKPLGEVIPRFFRRFPSATWATWVPVGQALSSFSRIYPNVRPEPGHRGKRLGEQFARAISAGADPSTPRYPYIGQTQYVALALVLQAVKKQPFETYCADKVFGPLGVDDADLNSGTRNRNAWGGWRVSTTAYARMLDYYRRGSPLYAGIEFRIIDIRMPDGYYGPVYGVENCHFYEPQSCRFPFKTDHADDPAKSCGGIRAEFTQWQDDVTYVASYKTKCDVTYTNLSAELEMAAYPEASPFARR